jgi:hypothetical protein
VAGVVETFAWATWVEVELVVVDGFAGPCDDNQADRRGKRGCEAESLSAALAVLVDARAGLVTVVFTGAAGSV